MRGAQRPRRDPTARIAWAVLRSPRRRRKNSAVANASPALSRDVPDKGRRNKKQRDGQPEKTRGNNQDATALIPSTEPACIKTARRTMNERKEEKQKRGKKETTAGVRADETSAEPMRRRSGDLSALLSALHFLFFLFPPFLSPLRRGRCARSQRRILNGVFRGSNHGGLRGPWALQTPIHYSSWRA